MVEGWPPEDIEQGHSRSIYRVRKQEIFIHRERDHWGSQAVVTETLQKMVLLLHTIA